MASYNWVPYSTFLLELRFKFEKEDVDFSSPTAKFIKTWFLDDATRMNPNLDYGQVQRGPGKSKGTHTGVLYVSISSLSERS